MGTYQLDLFKDKRILASDGNFHELREWNDARWEQARESIQAQNEKDRSQRS